MQHKGGKMELREQLEQAMAAMETQRGALGDAVVDAALAAFREKIAALEKPPAELSPEGQGPQRQVTVLFAEVVSPPGQDLSQHVDATFWQRLEAVVTRAGGIAGRNNGNGVVAIFGARATHVDDPERAVRAALEMGNETRLAGGDLAGKLQLRAGLHSGLVLLGVGGAIPAAAALGETVSQAARLQAAAAREKC